MNRRVAENEAGLLALLERGSATSREIQDALELSQPTVSRLTSFLKGRLLRLGRGKSTRYALAHDIRGYGHDFPIYRVTGTGDVTPLGHLLALRRGQYWWELAEGGGELFDHLPWFVQDLRPAGFMGRAFARSHSEELRLPARLQDWNDEHVLVAVAAWGEDLMGNLIVGEQSLGRYLETARQPATPIPSRDRASVYPVLAEQALAGKPVGSSAAGEQPKFAVLIDAADGPHHVLVKFSPPTDTDIGRRWADLLVCEHLALGSIADRNISAAGSELIEVGGRYFLEVRRFDRRGILGRLPVVSLMAVDIEFSGGPLDDWASAAQRLEARGQIPARDATQLRWLEAFGSLMANSDRHFGNISLIMNAGKQTFSLAPAYDTVPMLYRPTDEGVASPQFDPFGRVEARTLDQWDDALMCAIRFWETAAEDLRISQGFRGICTQNAATLMQAAGGPRLLAESPPVS